MNGAQSLIQTLVYCGVDTCFANPGTSEMHSPPGAGSGQWPCQPAQRPPCSDAYR
jgi:hypothetical protein